MTDDRFTHSAQLALMQAYAAAQRMSHSYIGSEHLLMGLFQQPSGRVYQALRDLGLTEEGLSGQVARREAGAHRASGLPVTLSDEAAGIIEGAAGQAALMKTAAVAPEHLLLAMLSRPDCAAAGILKSCGISGDALRRRLLGAPPAPGGAPAAQRPPQSFGRRELKLTLQFGVDMTQKALLESYDPVVGREEETARLIQVLMRRQKSNPVLLGDAGVGKTAIVEHLAAGIAAGSVPAPLVGRRVVALDLAGMISGTKYRGEFEERARQVLEEVRAAGNVILFIDEMHMIAGAGAAEGAIDAANIMKPALSRGHIQVIGATTTAEYKKYIRRDSALARRFQPIDIGEPTVEQTAEILRALQPRYERHHGVRIDAGAMAAAIELSARHQQDRRLPDKAIDLLDEAAAFSVLRRRYVVRAEEVRAVLAQQLGVEEGQLSQSERARLARLPALLSRRVVGQPEAVDAVAGAVRRTRAFGGRGRPCSFLFCGPSGVGKTRLACALAELLFGSEKQMLRLDMSEFIERHSVSRLIGSPPGYVGFGEGGRLTEGIRRKPYSVVLLDEVEKAHPDVLNLLLQILEDGALTDSEGEPASFQNAVVIMTSNLGHGQIAGGRRAGFGGSADEGRRATLEAVKKGFRPELLNRIDQIAVFRPLGRDQLAEIAGIELEALRLRLEKSGVMLRWTPEAAQRLAEQSEDPALGARPLKRRITAEVEEPIALRWLDSARPAQRYTLALEGGRLDLREESPLPAAGGLGEG